jgi:hypothetical protein
MANVWGVLRGLPPGMVRAYLDDGGGHCPFHASTDIEAGPPEADGDSAWRPVTCPGCGGD